VCVDFSTYTGKSQEVGRFGGRSAVGNALGEIFELSELVVAVQQRSVAWTPDARATRARWTPLWPAEQLQGC
jgi:hypothetical protein